jgi:hypothetical protein
LQKKTMKTSKNLSRTGQALLLGASLPLIASLASIRAQQPGSAADVVQLHALSFNLPQHQSRNQEILRVINDPGAHALWLLSPDPSHPGGPGRLECISQPALLAIRRPDSYAESQPIENRQSAKIHLSPPLPDQNALNLTPVIHAGDRILLEQHTSTLDSTFSAIALGPARAGANFDVRLAVGGKKLHAIALAPGRAVLSMQQETSFGASE